MPSFCDVPRQLDDSSSSDTSDDNETNSEGSTGFTSTQEDFQDDVVLGSKRRVVQLSASKFSQSVRNSSVSSVEPPTKRRKQNNLASSGFTIVPPPLVYPKSQYEGWQPPLSKSQESHVLGEFRALAVPSVDDSQSSDQFEQHNLEDFTIYRPNTGKNYNEMVSLEHINIELGSTTYYFDGILEESGIQRYVQQRPIRAVNIGGYNDWSQHSNASEIWIQSIVGERENDTWYRLQKPASEYARYHEAFIWLAGFSKHFVDYMTREQGLTLNSFREGFAKWVDLQHGMDAAFLAWRAEFGASKDFRKVLATHTKFLHRESTSIEPVLENHPIWTECRSDWLNTVQEDAKVQQRTVVTPFVEACFRHMPWSACMVALELAPDVSRLRQDRIRDLGFGSKQSLDETDVSPCVTARGSSMIIRDGSRVYIGDVVIIRSEGEARYAYIQGFCCDDNTGILAPKLLWLYDPSMTTCRDGRYLFKNELFLSDRCNCHSARVASFQMIRKVPVSLFSVSLYGSAEFFIRTRFLHEKALFMALAKTDLRCHCANDDLEKLIYSISDTVLIQCQQAGKEYLEPVEIVDLIPRRAPTKACVRRFRRRRRDYADRAARPNELTYTEQVDTVSIRRIRRRCHIRVFDEEHKVSGCIPAPYNRDGTSDAYYIISREDRESRLLPLHPSTIKRPGFDPQAPSSRPKLSGLDLFCGGGNFGRGLEEGGAIQIKAAIDFDKYAIHTYRANLKDTENTLLYCQSVDDFIAKVIIGAEGFPKVGSFNIIMAGSPCQGFSLMNQDKLNAVSLNNISKVASVASFIDLYRPEYALLENVTSMASGTESVFSQLICCLVAMGYQVQQFRLDAWSFGSPQSRERLFLSIAAPSGSLPPPPPLTHSHPEGVRRAKLGQLSSGEEFGARKLDEIPVFDFVSAKEATEDLPFLGEGHASCIPHPDHRVNVYKSLYRNLMHNVPKAPKKQGFQDAVRSGWQAQRQVDMFNAQKSTFKRSHASRAWSRVDPDGLYATIMTGFQPYCALAGRMVHWQEDRIISLMEARRAQSIPDDEVLIGSFLKKWKIVGNSVARSVALALGMTYREPWLAMEDVSAIDIPLKIATTSSEHRLSADGVHQLLPGLIERPFSPQDAEPISGPDGTIEAVGSEGAYDNDYSSTRVDDPNPKPMTSFPTVFIPRRRRRDSQLASQSPPQARLLPPHKADYDGGTLTPASDSSVLHATFHPGSPSRSRSPHPSVCFHCSSNNTPQWRHDRDDHPQCNACYVYERQKGIKRPRAHNKAANKSPRVIIMTRKSSLNNPVYAKFEEEDDDSDATVGEEDIAPENGQQEEGVNDTIVVIQPEDLKRPGISGLAKRYDDDNDTEDELHRPEALLPPSEAAQRSPSVVSLDEVVEVDFIPWLSRVRSSGDSRETAIALD